jgi:Fur family transcriptional regulator, ferric uptake regulator
VDFALQLREKKLKVTPARLNVIKLLDGSHLAYSHSDLESVFSTMDRVTLYRILNDFEDAGIVHKIIDKHGVTRFAICKSSCPDGQHTDNHVHFNCEGCHKMFCLEKVHVPNLKMPDGFKATGLHTLIYGICNNCSAA